MTLQKARPQVGRHLTPPDSTPRLRLKPKAPQTGYVDGAWWPHSDDLTSNVRLEGDRLQAINTLEVLGLNRNKILLLVVPPHTDPDHAHTTMMAAAVPNNDSTVDGLLMTSARDRTARTKKDAMEERWASEGGAEG